MERTPRLGSCCVLPSCVYEGLVGGGGMGLERTLKLGFHLVVSSLVVFMKG